MRPLSYGLLASGMVVYAIAGTAYASTVQSAAYAAPVESLSIVATGGTDWADWVSSTGVEPLTAVTIEDGTTFTVIAGCGTLDAVPCVTRVNPPGTVAGEDVYRAVIERGTADGWTFEGEACGNPPAAAPEDPDLFAATICTGTHPDGSAVVDMYFIGEAPTIDVYAEGSMIGKYRASVGA